MENEWGEIVNHELVLCHKESDLSPRPELFKGHLDILCRSKGYHIAILVSVLDAQWTIVTTWATQTDFSANLFHKIVILCRSRDLDDENVFVEVDLNLNGRAAAIPNANTEGGLTRAERSNGRRGIGGIVGALASRLARGATALVGAGLGRV
jgi:hypothetical protein